MSMVRITKFLAYLAINITRRVVDLISDAIFGYCYHGKKQPLQPIKNALLLETATTQAKNIRKGLLKSEDLVKAYISRIRDIQPVINAVVDERYQQALEEAKHVDRQIMSKKKSEEEIAKETPFLGVPFSVKEAIAVKGLSFTTGLVCRKGIKSSEDSDVVALLRKAGAIPLVSTNTSELCMWWETYNNIFGRTNNPYDTTKIVGGSSGGEGAILASAGSVIGVGNDIGGSIRIPSFFNGTFGHKPTRGIVSNRGQHPVAEGDLQTYLATGPMCRYATDLTPVLKVLAGKNCEKLQLDSKVDFRKIKVYYMEDDGGNPFHTRVDPEIRQAQRKVLAYLERNYNVKTQKVFLKELRQSFKMWCFIMSAADVQPLTVEMAGRKGEIEPISEFIKWLLGCSNHTLPLIILSLLNKAVGTKDEKQTASYFAACSNLHHEFQEMLGNDGIFLYPSHPETAPHHNQPVLKPFNVAYTAIFNILGLPVTQCPLGLSSKGMPLGLQIIGNLYCDHLTIALALELEKAFGGWTSPSAIAV